MTLEFLDVLYVARGCDTRSPKVQVAGTVNAIPAPSQLARTEPVMPLSS
jgi:hypothetical protein